ncbi:MAG: glycoside hydrolase family 16 protein [Winogradskyella sp.]|uniref:glycoside hydrolase family 16 protein n=1 Tax=Winogradskyella sp. TaxID=1883156 RepID=UPI000F41469A|nr:glycoside hydrolase family 16 protein [Winogradskyella sp.]RNC84261.1 MAG: glycoside hydrolase family 16 protein [Winogradskyella sp.]
MKIRFNKSKSLSILALASLTILFTCDLDETQEVVTLNNLIWEDNFDTEGSVDRSRWTFDLGDGSAQGLPGWGNNELQYYTDRPENVRVENGVLIITAREESFEGSDYTSARLKTEGLFEQQYGRFEARIRVPYGQGYWPAFWMLGVPDSPSEVWPFIGEIDIMEYLGDSPSEIFGTIHGPEYSGGESISKEYVLEGNRFDTDFHIFGIEWGPGRINFYVDDVLYQSLTPEDVADETNGLGEWVFDRPFYMLLNVAVGGNLPGPPNADTIFPQSMFVDYVRVYN